MKISGTHEIDAPPEQVWKHLIDPRPLSRCIPGCKQLKETKPRHYKAQLELRIAGIKGGYEGEVRMLELHAPSHFKMAIEGQGKAGHLKGIGEIDLQEKEQKTLINYSGDVQVGGLIATVGQRMISAAAKNLANQFFENLQKLVK